MLGDNASHRVFKISELSRAIASHLIPISPESTVNLARTCRYLEEPVLSALWEEQSWVVVLLKVLPEGSLDHKYIESSSGWEYRIVGNPSPEAWNRVRRYASWMHRVSMDEGGFLGEDTIRQFRLNAPAGGWFPALRDFRWIISTAHLPYVDLFFSPNLVYVRIYTPRAWSDSRFPLDILPALASTISALPTSALHSLSICAVFRASLNDAPWAYFKDSFSSAVLRCGPSLMNLVSPIPLSDAAVDHVIRLPHLRTWNVEGPPPNFSASSPPLVFPPLTEFRLGEASTPGWLSLFRRLEVPTSATQGVTPLSGMKESLRAFGVDAPSTAPKIVIPSFSTIRMFRNLLDLDVGGYCPNRQCTFELNDDNVRELATALPQLETLLLGYPCDKNTCVTTVACLLQISVHCVKLQHLVIHFNTTNIVGDLKNISMNPRFQELHSLPKCKLWYLVVRNVPLVLNDSDVDTVVDGMRSIFPWLRGFSGSKLWSKLSKKLGPWRK